MVFLHGDHLTRNFLIPFINQVKPSILQYWITINILNGAMRLPSFSLSYCYQGQSSTEGSSRWIQKSSRMKKKTFEIKSMFGFTPISEDGMMVVAWTDKTQEIQDQEESLSLQDSIFYTFLTMFFLKCLEIQSMLVGLLW